MMKLRSGGNAARSTAARPVTVCAAEALERRTFLSGSVATGSLGVPADGLAPQLTASGPTPANHRLAAPTSVGVAAAGDFLTLKAGAGRSTGHLYPQGFPDLGTLSAVPGYGPYEVSVDWGDGTADTTLTMDAPGALPWLTHAYDLLGDVTVTISAVDAAGHAAAPVAYPVFVYPAEIHLWSNGVPDPQVATAGRPQFFVFGYLQANFATPGFHYRVDWGDGTSQTDSFDSAGEIPRLEHAYATAKNYTIKVSAADSAGHAATSTLSLAVTVAPAPVKKLTLTPPAAQSTITGTPTTVALGSLAATRGVAPYKVTVNWGDGTAPKVVTLSAAGKIPATAHTYAKTGTFTTKVTATDAAGLAAAPVSFAVTVKPTTLALTAPAAQTGVAGFSRAFKIGTLAATNAKLPYRLTVKWGDGTPDTVVTATAAGALPAVPHKFAKAGKYTVRVFATDSAGHAAPQSVSFAATIALPATIAGRVFNDVNADGKVSPGEAGIGNYRVYLDANNDGKFNSATERGLLTNSTGAFSFAGLVAGTYVVRVVSAAGVGPTKPATNMVKLTVSAGQSITNVLFGQRAR